MRKASETICIRPFHKDDAVITAAIFFDAVQLGSIAPYDAAQRHAWAPEVPDCSSWLKRLKPQTVLVAVQDSKVVGFMTLRSDGNIDLAFVSPGQIGTGVAYKLYQALEAKAISIHLKKLTSDASHMARPFFERQGWRLVAEQSVARGKVFLTNFLMEKSLD